MKKWPILKKKRFQVWTRKLFASVLPDGAVDEESDLLNLVNVLQGIQLGSNLKEIVQHFFVYFIFGVHCLEKRLF